METDKNGTMTELLGKHPKMSLEDALITCVEARGWNSEPTTNKRIKVILEDNGFDSEEIRQYLELLSKKQHAVLTSDKEVIDDFCWWKEQQEIGTEKILDSNYYSSL